MARQANGKMTSNREQSRKDAASGESQLWLFGSLGHMQGLSEAESRKRKVSLGGLNITPEPLNENVKWLKSSLPHI